MGGRAGHHKYKGDNKVGTRLSALLSGTGCFGTWLGTCWITGMECSTGRRHARLVVELAVKGQANSLQKQARISVVGGVCSNGNVATGNHLGGVSGV